MGWGLGIGDWGLGIGGWIWVGRYGLIGNWEMENVNRKIEGELMREFVREWRSNAMTS
jgi:hypothetical protein